MQIVQAWEGVGTSWESTKPTPGSLEIFTELGTIIFRFQRLNVWGCAGGSVSISISIDMKYI